MEKLISYVIYLFLFIFIFDKMVSKYKNPYKLVMVFGKKGSGKSSFLVRQAIKYQRKGYAIYTNMQDCCLDGVRIINPDDLGNFVPIANSVLLLDEVGMLYDNRNYKSFKPAVRDFFKLQRHYKVICFMASQSFDVDIKLRNLTDEMILVSNVFTVFSLIRPIRKTVTLTEATSEGESRIAENLKFRIFTSWRMLYIPKTIKYFESFKVPQHEFLTYKLPENPIKVRTLKKKCRNKKIRT